MDVEGAQMFVGKKLDQVAKISRDENGYCWLHLSCGCLKGSHWLTQC